MICRWEKMKRNRIKILVTLILIILVGGFYALGLGQYLSVDFLASRQGIFQHYSNEHPLLAANSYFVLVFLLSALSLPGISIVIMVAGLTFFDFWTTLLVASFADSLGSTAAFLTSRYLFGQSLQSRYPDQLAIINRGVEKDGGYYLFSLRLMFFFPCFIINLLMGLTSLRALTFYWVTQVGKLPYKILFTYTGIELGQVSSPTDLLSPQLLIGFSLIGFLPLLSKKMLHRIRKHKQQGQDMATKEHAC